jgi:hypothetical protein
LIFIEGSKENFKPESLSGLLRDLENLKHRIAVKIYFWRRNPQE